MKEDVIPIQPRQRALGVQEASICRRLGRVMISVSDQEIIHNPSFIAILDAASTPNQYRLPPVPPPLPPLPDDLRKP